MRLRLIRHATLAIEYNGHNLLVDPMLDDAEARGPVQNTPNQRKNPLVGLPIPAAQVVDDVEAVLVTHTHSDHWDGTAVELIERIYRCSVRQRMKTSSGSKGFQMFSR
jgi:L-ascorbate metabolism protein UlaG (beta-lactamase superfamily)